jgi:YD repeat-containing protein
MKTDREKFGLRGAVQSVLVETVQLEEEDGQVAEKRPFHYAWIFNKDGWLIEQSNRNPDGSEWRTINDYSDSGKLLASRVYEGSGALVSETKYIYDEKDRLVAEQSIDRDGNVTTSATYVYDDAGGKTKLQELRVSEDAALLVGIEGTSNLIAAGDAKRMETRYNDRGDAIEVKLFNGDGVLVRRTEITRDERGNAIEETQYHGDVVPFVPDSCSTEQMESLTEEQKAEIAQATALTAQAIALMFSPGSVAAKQTHEYDDAGRVIESKLTMMGIVANRTTVAYDEAGNKSEEVTYNEDGSFGKAILTHDYDEHGNWTTETVSTASSWDSDSGLPRPAHLTRRTITYYG